MTPRLWAIHRVGPNRYVATPPDGHPPLGELTCFAVDEDAAKRAIEQRVRDEKYDRHQRVPGETYMPTGYLKGDKPKRVSRDA